MRYIFAWVGCYIPHLGSYRTSNIQSGLVGLRVYLNTASYHAWQPEHPGEEPVEGGAPVPQSGFTCICLNLDHASDRIAEAQNRLHRSACLVADTRSRCLPQNRTPEEL
jgi:hypothetical protein